MSITTSVVGSDHAARLGTQERILFHNLLNSLINQQCFLKFLHEIFALNLMLQLIRAPALIQHILQLHHLIVLHLVHLASKSRVSLIHYIRQFQVLSLGRLTSILLPALRSGIFPLIKYEHILYLLILNLLLLTLHLANDLFVRRSDIKQAVIAANAHALVRILQLFVLYSQLGLLHDLLFRFHCCPQFRGVTWG